MEDIKSELKDLVDEETDPSILEAVRTILKKTRLDPILKDRLTNRALIAENDIENGDTLSRQEVVDHIDRTVGS